MALKEWINSDKWVSIKSKFNAIITLLKGGYIGQVFVSNGGSSDPSWQDIEDAVLPEQTGQDGKFLQTNSGVASWEEIPSYIDRQIDSASLGIPYPTSAPGQTVLSTLTAAAGVNRNYIIMATVTFARITTSPETEFRIRKNGSTLISYPCVAIPVDGHRQTHTFTWYEENVSPSDEFTLTVYSPSANQITINKYTFILYGNI